MFLRKIISTSLILSASIGSSVTVGSDAQTVLRVDVESVAQESSAFVRLPTASTHRLTLSAERLKAMVTDSNSRIQKKTTADERRTQKAERIAHQLSQRKALRRVTHSFKAPRLPIHQPR